MSEDAATEPVTEITAGNKTWLAVGSYAANNTERWRCYTPMSRLMIDCYRDDMTGRWHVTCHQIGLNGWVMENSKDWTREEACLRALVEIQKVLTSILKDISVHGT